MGRIRKIIPSMFHRRLALLGVLMVAAFVPLTARLGWVTVVKGADLRADAESLLVRETLLPTVRGRILDRHGRVLAQDRPSYDLRVDYSVLSGAWAWSAARSFAYRAHRDVWGTLDEEGKLALAARYLPAYERRVEEMWSLLAEGSQVPRAEIDQARREVIERVEAMQAAVTVRRERSEREKLARAGVAIGPEQERRIRQLAAAPIEEKTIAHAIVRGVSDEVGFRFMRLAERAAPMFAAVEVGEVAFDEQPSLLPGLRVEDATERVYPFGSMRVEIDQSTLPKPIRADGAMQVELEDLAGLMLGSVRRQVYKEDVDRRAQRLQEDESMRSRAVTEFGLDTGAYNPTGDRVGHTGIEAAMEDTLRGLRGVRRENLQTRDISERAPEPGRDVRLTVDIQLQARVRAILDPSVGLTVVQPWHNNEYVPLGTELDAAAVVLDIASGDILAMVSMPEAPRDGDWSKRGLEGRELEKYLAVHTPFVNRAVGKPYQPGSIVKALILCGAVKSGEFAIGERIRDTGHYFANQPNLFRSWIYKSTGGAYTHSDQLGRDPDEIDALMVSGNVFFFTLADRLGNAGVAEVYRAFGVGEPFGLGLGAEWPGSIGGLTNGVNDGSDLTRQDAILLGIGQGPITWTPLHAADSYATIARGGYRIVPRLVTDGGAPPRAVDLQIPARAVRSAMEGLRKAANDPQFGTGYHFAVEDGTRDRIFNAPGVTIWGKTGTADSSPVTWDPDGDGPQEPITERNGDHSWYVILVGDEGGPAKFAISVVVDYGGSGGRVSGPIANQIVHALIEEGYLKGGDDTSPPRADAGGGR
jgi:penicillin-binding protein 2